MRPKKKSRQNHVNIGLEEEIKKSFKMSHLTRTAVEV